MADKQTKGIVINIEANTSTVSRQINALRQEFKQFEKDINNISKAFDIDGTPLVNYSTKLYAVESASREAEKVVKELSAAMKAMENTGLDQENIHSYAMLAQRLADSKKQAQEATTRLNELKSGIADASQYAQEFANNFSKANTQISQLNTAFKFDPSTVENAATKLQLLQTASQSAQDALEMLREEMSLRLSQGASIADPEITALAEKIGLMQKNVDDSKLSLDNYVTELANVASGFSQAKEHADAFANRFTTLESTVRNLDTALQIDPTNLDLVCAKMDAMDLATDSARGEVEKLTEALQAKLSQGLTLVDPEVSSLAAQLANAKEKLETSSKAAQEYGDSLKPAKEAMIGTAEASNEYTTSLSKTEYSLKSINKNSKDYVKNLEEMRSKSQTAIKATESAMQSLAKAMVLNPQGFKDTSELMELLQKAAEETSVYMAELNAEIEEKHNSDYEDTAKEVAELKGELAEAGEKLKTLNSLQEQLNGTTQQSNTVVRELADGNTNLSKTTDNVSGSFEKSESKISSWNIALGNLAATAIRRGITQLKRLASEVYQTGSSFDNSSNSLKAMYGDISDYQFNSLEEQFRSLGLVSEHSATQINESSQALALAGYNVEQTSNAIKPILQLAEGMGEDFSTMSDIVVDGLAEFGMQSDQATHFADVLAKTALSTNTDVTDLGEAMKYAGSVAGSFGYSVEDVAQALGTMATQGVKGSTAGSALRTMLTRISSNTSEANDKLEELGVHFFDANGNANDLSDTLTKLREVMKGMSTQEKAQLAYVVTGTRGLTALTAIVNSSEEEWDALGEKISHASGTVEDVANQRLDNLYGDAQKLNNTFEDLSITLYQSVSPAMRETVQELTSFLQTDETRIFVKRIGKDVSKAFDTLSNVFKALAPNLNQVVTGFENIIGLMGSLLVAKKVSKGFDTMASMVTTASTALEQLSTGSLTLTSALGGTGAVISGLIVLYSALKGAVDMAQAKWDDEHPQIVSLREAYDDLSQSIDTTKDALSDSAKSAYDSYSTNQSLLDELDTLVDSNGKVKEGMEDRVSYILNELSSAYGIEYSLVDGVIDKYGELRQTLKQTSDEQASYKFVESLNEQLTDAYQEMAEAKGNISQASQAINDEINDLLSGNKIQAHGGINDWIGQEWDVLKNQVGIGYDEFIAMSEDKQKEFIEQNASWFDTVFQSSIGKAQEEMEKATSSLSETYSTVKAIQDSMELANEGDLEGAIQLFYDYTNQIVDSATSTKDQISQLWNEYDAVIKEMADPKNANIAGQLDEYAHTILDKITELQGFTADPNNRLKIYVDTESLGKDTESAIANVKNGLISSFYDLGYEGGDLNAAANEAGTNTSHALTQGMIDEADRAFQEEIIPQSYENSNQTIAAYEKTINYGEGQRVVGFYLQGMIDKMSDPSELALLENAGTRVANVITNAVKKSWNEHSPSKVAKGLAAYFGEGLILGLESKMNELASTASKVAGVVTNSMAFGANAVSGLFGTGSNYSVTQNLTFNGNYSKRDGLSVARDLDRILGGAI